MQIICITYTVPPRNCRVRCLSRTHTHSPARASLPLLVSGSFLSFIHSRTQSFSFVHSFIRSFVHYAFAVHSIHCTSPHPFSHYSTPHSFGSSFGSAAALRCHHFGFGFVLVLLSRIVISLCLRSISHSLPSTRFSPLFALIHCPQPLRADLFYGFFFALD